MTTEIFLLVICAIAIVLLIIFRKTTFVKKNWRYALVLIPAVLVLILKILTTIRSKNAAPISTNDETLKDQITTIKGKLEEVNTVVKIEAAVEKTKNDQLMTQLKEVQQIPDDRERRKRLAEMVG
jgi:glucan phosphoethanolaminetransferase (alkaline phosphatase superfamily)